MNSMLKYTTLLLFFFSFITISSAQYIMTNGGMISDCSGTFTDSGGGGNYGDNEDLTYTICSDGTGGLTHVGLTFATLANISAGDVLCIYDGDDITAPLIMCSDNVFGPVNLGYNAQASAVNPSGCLTITFTSDGAGNSAGWDANLVCNQQCQLIFASIANSTPAISPVDTGYLDVCPGELVLLQGAGIYPQNNLIYAQSDNTSSFEWDFGDGTGAFGPNVQHIYAEPGGYIIQLTITDETGCSNTNFITQRVRVSGPPSFNIDPNFNNIICAFDTIAVYTAVNDAADISIEPNSYGFQAGGAVADSICIPDNDGTIYNSSLELSSFSPGQTLNNVNDIIGICIDIEHSYLGDLEIELTCPDGTTVPLKSYASGGGGTYLGFPVDNDATACQGGPIGQGATYCFTPIATNGTLAANATGGTLPPGDYEATGNLNNFVGCPLNGEWVISIEDYLGIDDGVIFSWELVLNEDIIPNLEVFDLSIVDAGWLNDPSIIINSPDSMIAVPQFPGNINYVFEATDNFGCVYDTTIIIEVLPQTDPGCYSCTGNLTPMADVTICDDGENTQLNTTLENVSLTTTTFQDTPNAVFGNNTNPPNNPLTSTINVVGLPYNFIDANSIQSVCLNINSINDIEINATLVAPNGTTVALTSFPQSGIVGFQSLFTGTCFTPSATDLLSTGTGPFTGDWVPVGDLNTLVGSQANGNWTLQISDQFPGFDTNVLQNWSISFNLTSDLTYTWTPNNGDLTCYNCPNPVAQPTTTTTYNVSAVDGLGCTFTESVTVTVDNCNVPCTLAASLTSSTDATCSGTLDGTALITSTGQVGSATYVLDGITTQVNNGNFTGLSNGPHQVIVTDSENCTATVDFVINTPNPIVLTLTPTDPSCNGGMNGSISSTTTGGDNTYTYSWNTGAITSDLTNIAAGTYTLVVTDGNNCSATESITVNEPSSVQITLDHTPVNCIGGSDGTATATVSGGTGNVYTYIWSDPTAQTTNPATNLPAGTYTVTTSDINLCTATASIEVTQPLTAVTVVSIDQTVIACAGDNTSEATVVATGGTGTYTYAWSSGGIADVETNLAPGTYTVIITDENLCTVSETVAIVEHTLVEASISGTNLSCNASNDGTATTNGTGGSGTYTYLWDDPNAQTTPTANNLAAGTYIVIVTDANNCTATNTITLTEPDPIVLALTPTDPSCNGGVNGSISSTTTGGDNTYTYLWNTGAVTSDLTNIAAGTYTLVVTDGNNCSVTESTTINEPSLVQITLDSTTVSCIGGSDGTATATVTGGTGNVYTFLWNDGTAQTTNPATNLSAGTYTVTASDVNLCTSTASIVVTEPLTAVSVVSIDQTITACAGDNTSEATVVATGGTGTYTYAWSSGGIADVETNLAPGTYTVIIADENACIATETITIVEYTLVEASITGTNISCNAANDGTATANGTGGAGTYTYLWDDINAQTTPTANNLMPGTYIVIVTDANNCTATNTITLTEPDPLTQIDVIGDVSCFGGSDGFAGSFQQGGVYPYQYQWSTGNIASSTDSPYGSWDLGANGCIQYTSKALVSNFVDTICYTATDGINTIEAYVVTSVTATDNCAGNNTDTDGDGVCDAIDPDINDPCNPNAFDLNNNGVCDFAEPNIISTSYIETTVATVNTACINLPATFDIANTSYTYCDTSDGTLVNNLSAGTYTLTITDDNGCSIVKELVVGEPDVLQLSFTQTDVNCLGGNDGTATVTAIGGTETYTYLWSDAATTTTDVATGLSAGDYNVTVTDTNLCTVESTVTIIEPLTGVQITSLVQTDTSCLGDNQNVAVVIATGGTGNYTYAWSSGGTTDTEMNLSPGTYTVTVSDDNACIFSQSVNIEEYTLVEASITGTNISCNAVNDGTATVSGTGGSETYTYLWDDANAQTTATATNLAPGTYNVTVTDVNLCSATNTISLTEPSPLTQIDVVGDVSCFGGSDGFAGSFQSGGVYPYQYEWSTGNIASSTESPYGTWDLDANGCIAYGSKTLTGMLVDTICYTATDGINTIEAYVITSVTATDNCAGNNTDTDGDGVCDAIDPDINDPCNPNAFDLNNNGVCDFAEPDVISVSYIEIPVTSAGTACVTLPATFDAANTTYTYCNTGSGTLINNLSAGTYTVTISDDNGCSIIRELVVREPDVLQLSFTQTDVNCLGGDDGTATVTAIGGTAPYTYLWNNLTAETTDIATGLSATTYSVTVTDANACTIENTVTIIEPATAVQVTAVTQITIGCNGSNESEAEVTATGGTGLYTYNWSTGATTAIASNLPAGTHTVTVTDANGCPDSSTVDIIEYAAMAATTTSTPVSCFGGSDGTASVTLISGGAGSGNLIDYTYVWSGSIETGSTISGLSAGNYIVTITDIEGCTTTSSIDVGTPTELTASIFSSNSGCSDDENNGIAVVTPLGGTAPYTYEWDSDAGSATVDSISGLAPGGYNVTVTDANNCFTIAYTSIYQVEPITVTLEAVNNLCYGGNNGSLTAITTGGAAPLSYIWSTGDTTTVNTIGSLTTGGYTVTVVDANGCEQQNFSLVTHPDELIYDIDLMDPTCFGDQDGSILLTPSGGVYPYTYSFNNQAFSSTNYLGNLTGGDYSAIIQDNNGCQIVLNPITLNEPLEIEAIIYPSSDLIELPLGDTLDIAAVHLNGIGTIEYVWDALYDPSTLSCDTCQYPVLSTYENDRYTVTVTDENGCSATEDVEVIVPRDRAIFVPSGFSPNGDDINDFLMVHGKTGTIVESFRVYDRWGELVFRADAYDINSTNGSNTWNGELKGKPMNPGVFVWHLDVLHIDGRKESFQGNTSLVR